MPSKYRAFKEAADTIESLSAQVAAEHARAERAEQQLAERDAELAAYKAENATKLAEIKRLLDELGKLKGHARAMHKVLSWLDATGGKGLREHAVMGEVLDAYRAAYPKE